MVEKEIVVDLSGKIKFSDSLYVSVGTLLLSGIIMLIQTLWIFAHHNWQFDPLVFSAMFDFVLAIRGENNNKKLKNKGE